MTHDSHLEYTGLAAQIVIALSILLDESALETESSSLRTGLGVYGRLIARVGEQPKKKKKGV